jgi:hypothetical protein
MIWSALVHDPGPLAWIVVAAYAAGALLAFAAASRARARERSFWLATAVVLVLLGINKQLDLQTDLTQAGRFLARSEGWYRSRKIAQGVFILAIAVGAAACGALLWGWLRDAASSVKAAALGVVVLLAFIFVRAASFHHIDYWIAINIAGMRSGWWLELLGVAIIGGAAAKYRGERSNVPVGPD